ncbi:MAG: hypothetical protein ACYCDI_03150 [Corynebacterium aurimucosum]|uniref:hypothetical protein n=1 Tax=Corynebacterium sp. HMSC066C02 TaxID=1739500 RepID=UPI0008A56129|nr:hypothetical protein [Corynebacterium sp. HMSC066C02]OFP24506.1 hypothetical protein HMPREF2996_00370 [Corynebacterium sp. HMSC066C02]
MANYVWSELAAEYLNRFVFNFSVLDCDFAGVIVAHGCAPSVGEIDGAKPEVHPSTVGDGGACPKLNFFRKRHSAGIFSMESDIFFAVLDRGFIVLFLIELEPAVKAYAGKEYSGRDNGGPKLPSMEQRRSRPFESLKRLRR